MTSASAMPSRSLRQPPDAPTPRSGLKICPLGKYYPPALGGIETHVQTLARAQAALAAALRAVCINHPNRAGHDITWARFGRTETLHEFAAPVPVTRCGRSRRR